MKHRDKPDRVSDEDWKSVDSPALSDEALARLRPVSEKTLAIVRRGRGPQRSPTKEAVSIRLDRDILMQLRSSGEGWQSRINDILRKSLKPTADSRAHPANAARSRKRKA